MQKSQTNNNQSPKNAVQTFMKRQDLEQYTQALINLGYDDLVVLKAIGNEELGNVAKLVKMKPGHAAKFVWALTKQPKVTKNATNCTKKNETTSEAKKEDSTGVADTSVYSKCKKVKNFVVRLFTGKIFSKKQAKASGGAYVAMVVDRSGSMRSMGCEVMNGFNTFVKEQKALPGKCSATVVSFDNEVEVLQHGVPLQQVREANHTTFSPRGMTALLDAIGQTVEMIENKVDSMANKPDKIMVMILTDGAENASKKFSKKDVMDKIQSLEATGDWEFVFVGANQDAIAVGASYGMRAKNCLTYGATPEYQNETFKCMSENMTSYRFATKSSYHGFTPAQRSVAK